MGPSRNESASHPEVGPPGHGCYEPFDPAHTARLVDHVMGPMLEHYFRPRLVGAERLPRRGPLILAANHSGNAFPYDAIVLDAALWLAEGRDSTAKLRSMFEKELAATWWMRPYGVNDFWRRAGGVDMTFDNFDRLLAGGSRVAYYPEGVPGIGKGFRNRYRLQPFKTSFVVLGARHRAPVYPVYIINAEWIVPFSFTLKLIDKIMQRLWRVPFLPLPVAPAAMVFPWAWWFALPARMVFVVGEPIDVRRLAEEAGITDFERPDRVRMLEVAERIRRRMQSELDVHVRTHGHEPYDLGSLRHELRRARRKRILHRVLPTGWAPTFLRLDRDRQRPPARNRLHRVLRDWDLIGFYLPFGWPFLSLTRALRRPPCGFRTLSRLERRHLEGRFVWRLSERPLPRSEQGGEQPGGPHGGLEGEPT